MAEVNREHSGSDVIAGRVTIDKNYSLAMADESFYRFFGKNSLYTLDKCIHEEDRQLLDNLVNGDETNSIIVRILRDDNCYRWCVLMRVNEKIELVENVFTELEFRDIISINERFSYMDENTNKYRNLLNMIDDRFFEYDLRNNMFKMYCYRNNRSDSIEMDTLDSWQERMLRLNFVEDTAIEPFIRLYDNLKEGVDSFTIQFENSIMKKGERKEILNFKGQTIYKGNEKIMVVGIISTVNRRTAKKDYYYSSLDNTKDSATGLLNKKAITEFSENRIKLAATADENKNLYLMIVDIDNFKLVNDTYGHMFGDEVISHLSTALKNTVGKRGVVGRIGGDEFMMFLEDIEDLDTIRYMLKSIRKSVALELKEKNPKYDFTCSIGISKFKDHGTSYDRLFKIADKALYIAKDKGKDRFIMYDPELHGELEEENIGINKSMHMVNIYSKLNLVTDISVMIAEKGFAEIQNAIDMLCDKMGIGGINIYYGNNMNCVYTSGTYPIIIPDADYINQTTYLSLFDEDGVNAMHTIDVLSMDYSGIYNMFKSSRICSSLQILIKSKGRIMGMISFDMFDINKRKWNNSDIHVLYIFARCISNVISESDKIDNR